MYSAYWPRASTVQSAVWLLATLGSMLGSYRIFTSARLPRYRRPCSCFLYGHLLSRTIVLSSWQRISYSVHAAKTLIVNLRVYIRISNIKNFFSRSVTDPGLSEPDMLSNLFRGIASLRARALTLLMQPVPAISPWQLWNSAILTLPKDICYLPVWW